jgi:hypothetical protein
MFFIPCLLQYLIGSRTHRFPNSRIINHSAIVVKCLTQNMPCVWPIIIISFKNLTLLLPRSTSVQFCFQLGTLYIAYLAKKTRAYFVDYFKRPSGAYWGWTCLNWREFRGKTYLLHNKFINDGIVQGGSSGLGTLCRAQTNWGSYTTEY